MSIDRSNYLTVKPDKAPGDFESSHLASLAVSQPQRQVEITVPSGLVICENESIRRAIAEVLVTCGVLPIFTASIGQAFRRFAASDFDFVVCQDEVLDGRYENILPLAIERRLPLIVVSRTGDWPEYFQAIDQGAHDFLAYPMIPGELQRIIDGFLVEPSSSRPPRTLCFG
jgi:DNA-binding NtrC family response regulator